MTKLQEIKEKLNLDPPQNAIKILVIQDAEGNTKEHKYLPISYSNELANELFDFVHEELSFTNTYLDKSKVIQTVSVKLCFTILDNDRERIICKTGISSQLFTTKNINYISQLLLTEAKKNAYAQLGNAFGSNLNRELLIEENSEENKELGKEEIEVAKLSKDERRVYTFIKNNTHTKEEKLKTITNDPRLLAVIDKSEYLKSLVEELKIK